MYSVAHYRAFAPVGLAATTRTSGTALASSFQAGFILAFGAQGKRGGGSLGAEKHATDKIRPRCCLRDQQPRISQSLRKKIMT
jgi:hypothetical protein